ncbi:hypothetical protein [Bdellovibrio sp. KM01]|uniref:hypothetical protein n=1 Tax=Bdellovibrio sp. KM01 TaxID=2748865 RepID=UPI0015EA8328|nr:hypothetical protein [Bdellovibrio sp. KM01]QLY26083.1 hypothetical protein HW988_03350 [Bdellovibrio sp. KM01]
MNKTFLTLSLLLVGLQAYAQKDTTCSEFAAYTCSSIGAADGTSVGSAKASKTEFADKLKSDTFPAVQKAFVKKIASLPLDEKARTALLAKFSGMKFSTECEQLGASLDESLWPNSFYTHSDNTFYLCKATPGMSEFVVSKMIASELSEMINPCGINSILQRPKEKVQSQEQSEKDYPIKGIISCLRSDKSAGAQRNNSIPFKESGFCTGDQITRSFTDWMTSEVVTDYISQKYADLSRSQWRQGIANAYRDECSFGRPDDGFTEEPEFKLRIDGIVTANPSLRKKLGCYDMSKYLYCDAHSPDAMAKAIGAPKAGSPSSSPSTPSKSLEGIK